MTDRLVTLICLATFLILIALVVDEVCGVIRDHTDRADCRARGGRVDYWDVNVVDSWRCEL